MATWILEMTFKPPSPKWCATIASQNATIFFYWSYKRKKHKKIKAHT